ncbi:hypothetical protein [Kribbella sp. NPDC049584]|uniref:hypothetical protein n=1 Tax=Kribbella sp. NPDC049584 TaxID=3154833 RepID=UPI00342716CE
MSDRASEARVNVLVADYAAADAAGKLNVVGGAWQVTGIQAESGLTGPVSLVVTIDLPPRFYGEEFTVEFALLDDAGNLVQVPGPTGGMIPLRIGQSVVAEKPAIPGQYVPEKTLWSRTQAISTFPNGLPLRAGAAYTWSVRIDGDDAHVWKTGFYVVGAPPGPVIG